MDLFMSDEGKNWKITVPEDTDFQRMIETDYRERLLAAREKDRDTVNRRKAQEILNDVCRPGYNAYRREMRHRAWIDQEKAPGRCQKEEQQAAKIQERVDVHRVEESRKPALLREYRAILRKKLPPKQAEMMIALFVDETETIESWAAGHGIREESAKRQIKRIRNGMKRSWFTS